MKKILLLLTTLLLPIAFTFAQKINKQPADFEYKQLPLKPLDKSLKNYQSHLILAYQANIEADDKKLQANYEQSLKDYDQQMKDWQVQKQEAQKKYDNDLAEWNKKSTGSKILEKSMNESSKPVLNLPSPPSKPYLHEKDHQKIFNPDLLATTYLKLNGFNNAADNAVQITVTLYGFENLEPELKTSEKNEYNTSTKSTQKVTTYWYSVSYKHPIGLKIEGLNGQVIYNEVPQQFNDYTVVSTPSSDGRAPAFDKKAFLSAAQDKIVEQNMKYLNDFINSNYGFTNVKRSTIITTVETKKMNYDDYQQAYENASAGYNLLASDNAGAVAKLNTSTGIWEKALTEFNPSEKKARIDEDIAMITHFNLAEAYIWTSNFDKAEEHLNKIIGLKPSKKEEREVEEYRKLLKDEKERWLANK